MSERDTLTDHDLLIRIDERVRAIHDRLESVDTWVAGHQRSHGRTTKVLSGISAALGAIAGFFASFFRN